ADVMAALPEEQTAAVLSGLVDKADIEELLKYPEDTAGGIMQTEMCVVEAGRKVHDAIEEVRKVREWVEDIFEVYVVDEAGRLIGSVSLEDLVLSSDNMPLAAIRRPVDTQ